MVRAENHSLAFGSYHYHLYLFSTLVPGERNSNSTPAESATVVRYFTETLHEMKQLFLIIFSIFISQNIFSQLPQEIEKNIFLKVIKNKFGLSDNSNKVIVPFIYDFIEYKNQKLIVRKQNSQGLLSIDNKILVPIKYQFVLPRNNNRFILWTHSSLFGLCDTSGKIIIPVKFKIISPLEIDNLYLTENDKQLNGVYDLNGNVVLKESYKFYTVDNNKIFATEKKSPLF